MDIIIKTYDVFLLYEKANENHFGVPSYSTSVSMVMLS